MIFPSMDDVHQLKLLTSYFSQFISDARKDFMERVLENRTRFVTLVLEDIYQSQNASAAIRTCECMGLQDVHVIESASTWSTNKQVLKGSNKWLNIVRYKKKEFNNAGECYSHLRQQGYRIVVADPSPDGVSIHSLDIDRPIALVMGNERHGSSEYAINNADLKVRIPMVGFTESLNISVSAAICINSILTRLRDSPIPWRLRDEEKEFLRLQWYKKSVKRSEVMEREYLRSIQ
jgi:tRNA (guanosine-2'-O-)-methyltransferase